MSERPRHEPAVSERRFDVTLRSEFGHVRLSEDRQANGPRLRVEALRTGQVIYLDPLELESLAGWRHEDLQVIVLTAPYTEVGNEPNAMDGGSLDADPG